MFQGRPDTGPYRRIDEVVQVGLCLRCGACGGLCPRDAISFDMRGLPIISEDACTECGLCAQICPGWALSLRKLVREQYGAPEDVTPVGPHVKCCICRSSDPDIRMNGASGGFVTQTLIHLLRTGQIKGALVASSGHGHLVPRAGIARTESEIRAAAGSNYCLFPWGMALREIMQADGPFALVGLPCHIHAFRKAVAVMPRLARKVPWVIGLSCSMNMKPWVMGDLLHARGLSRHKVDRIEFRAGEWPGRILAWMKSGASVELFPKEVNESCQAISHLKWTHGQWRCLLCPDRPALLADIAACDPWIRDAEGSYMGEKTAGRTVVICRTPEAWGLVKAMTDAGAIDSAEGDVESLLPLEAPRSVVKKRHALERVVRLKRRNRAHPRYDLPLPAPRVSGPCEIAAAIMIRVLHLRASGLGYLVFVSSAPGRVLSRLNAWRKRYAWRRKVREQRSGRGDG